MAASVKVSGGKAWKKALNPYVENADTVAKVGILEGATYATGPNAGELVAPIAAIHEFGTANIPARSFMRSTVEKKKAQWARDIAGILKANPGQIVKAFLGVGENAARDMQQAFEDGLEPPLKEETVERKKTMGADGKKLGKVEKGKRKGEQKTGPYAAHADKPVMLTGETQKAIALQVNDLPPVYPGKEGGA